MRRAFTGLRTEGAGAARETAAIALGAFIGCLPVYGFHLLLCWVAGALFGLNRLKMYLAANISNPLVAPWLVVAEVQTGAWVRRGAFHPLSRDAIASTGLAVFGVDAVVGSVVVGVVVAAIAGAGTYSLVREPGGDRWFADLLRRRARNRSRAGACRPAVRRAASAAAWRSGDAARSRRAAARSLRRRAGARSRRRRRLAFRRRAPGQPAEGARDRHREAAHVQPPHAGRVARVLRPPPGPERGAPG